MNLQEIVRTSEKFAADNSPAILTGIGVAGVITTAILSARAGVDSGHILSEESPYLSNKEKLQLTWKVWILPVSVGTATITAIIFANRIGTRRAAAMATAYVISEKAFEDYRAKVVEKMGQNKEQVVRDEIAQDRADGMGKTTIIVSDAKVLCIDQSSGRYFESTMEEIKKAVNDVNYAVLHYNYASLNEFYDKVGLSATSYSEEVGWNSDKLMDVTFTTVMTDSGKPALSMDFTVVPIRGYNEVH